MDHHTLVIAYGNRLRGDDGIGPAAGDIVNSWQVPGVKVLTVQQLVPELIEEMKNATRILFIDAAENVPGPWASSLVAPGRTRPALGHHDTPANLLALLGDLEGHAPDAWLLSISASLFEHGEQHSAKAAANLQAALAWIRRWIGDYRDSA